MVDSGIVILLIILIGAGAMVVRSEYYHLRPYDVGDMKAIDPSPGLPQVNYLNRIWEATHIRLHSNQYQFDLRLKRGREEERLVTFDISQITELHSLISVFFPRGPVMLDVMNGNKVNATINANGGGNGMEGVDGEKLAICSLQRRNAELQLERDGFEGELLRFQANFRDELESRWRDMIEVQTRGGAGGGMGGKKKAE